MQNIEIVQVRAYFMRTKLSSTDEKMKMASLRAPTPVHV